MGLDLYLVKLAWRGTGLPDWSGIARDAEFLSDDAANGIADELFLWEDVGEQELEEEGIQGGVLGLARLAAARAVSDVASIVDAGGPNFTVVRVNQWTVILAGGISSGEEPIPDWWDSWVVVGRSGLLSPDARRESIHSQWPPGWRDLGQPPRLAAIAMAPAVDWRQVRRMAGPRESDWIPAIEEAALGRYSRWALGTTVGDATLVVVDRGFASEALERLRACGVLSRLGTVLEDVRLAADVSDTATPTT